MDLFLDGVYGTPDFYRMWAKTRMNRQQEEVVRRKVMLLQENPAHPSLRTHKLTREGEIWACYLLLSYPCRLLYRPYDDLLFLTAIGGHELVDKFRKSYLLENKAIECLLERNRQ
jgi:hypothetical protein